MVCCVSCNHCSQCLDLSFVVILPEQYVLSVGVLC